MLINSIVVYFVFTTYWISTSMMHRCIIIGIFETFFSVEMVREGLGKTISDTERGKMAQSQLLSTYRVQTLPVNHVISENVR